MTTENNWTPLPTLQDVAKAQADGWEIEVEIGEVRAPWQGEMWRSGYKFRGRPRQPKMKEAALLCYVHKKFWAVSYGFAVEGCEFTDDWIRQPHLDMVAKVPE